MLMKKETVLPLIVVGLALILVLLVVYSQHIPAPVYQCWDGSEVSDPSLCPAEPWSWEGIINIFSGFIEPITTTICQPYEIFGVVIDLC